MEYSCGCISHASKTQLDRLDAAQRRFLHGLQIDERIALRVYNLAPPSLRRGIAIQGLIHKRVLGLAHSAFNSLLPFASVAPGTLHNKQLDSHALQVVAYHGLFARSLFGVVGIYNHLPQVVINFDNVSDFQGALTNIAKWRCNNGIEDWKYSFTAGYHGSYVGTAHG